MVSALVPSAPGQGLARDLPETAPRAASPRPTTQASAAPFTSSVVWEREVLRGVVNHPRINGMQGVRGSNPLSSTPGQRPCSASTAPESPASGSRWAAICVAGPIRSSDAAKGCCCRRPGSLGPAGGSVVSHGFAARSSPLAPVSTMQPMQSRWTGVSAGCAGSNPAGGSAHSMRSAHPSAPAPRRVSSPCDADAVAGPVASTRVLQEVVGSGRDADAEQ
jgi:hypothetical protein